MTPETYDTMMFIIRAFARIGFIVLLFQLWRLYNIFASPALKRGSRAFVRAFTVAVAASFFLMVTEVVTRLEWLPVLTMMFNTLTTYILVFYLNGQLRRIVKYKSSSEYAAMAKAMDDFILRLKQTRL